MARVTVEDCVLKVPNRFELVLLASQRARNISRGEQLTIDRDNDKNPVVALREIAEETLALPDLEPVTMSEVGTKLDLARAYMDMGDPEGARNILEEVLNEGSVAQKQEAQRLLQSLPG